MFYACIYATPGFGFNSCCLQAGTAHPLTSLRDAAVPHIGNCVCVCVCVRACVRVRVLLCVLCVYVVCVCVLCVCFPMPTHCTITCFGFRARRMDGVECGLFSIHAPLGQITFGASICIVYWRKLRLR